MCWVLDIRTACQLSTCCGTDHTLDKGREHVNFGSAMILANVDLLVPRRVAHAECHSGERPPGSALPRIEL